MTFICCQGKRRASVRHGQHSGVFSKLRESAVQGLLGGSLWLQENLADKILRKIRHQIDIRVFQNHGYGRGFMASQLEIRADPLDHSFWAGGMQHPVFEHALSQSFLAGTDEDHDPALFHRVLGVVQSLLGLIQIQILRRSALGNQDYIRPLRNLLAVNAVQEPAGFPVGFYRVPRPPP